MIKSSLDSKAFKKAFRTEVPDPHWRLITPEHANKQADRILERIRAFLSYVGLTALFLGGVGLFVIFRSQFLIKLGDFLTLRCLGARSKSLLLYALLGSLTVAGLGWLLGSGIGLGLEYLMNLYASQALKMTLAPASFLKPVALGAVVSLLVVGLAVVVPMGEVLKVPVSNVIRQNESQRRGFQFRDGLAILFVSALVVLIVGRSFKSGAFFLLALFSLAAILLALSMASTRVLSKWADHSAVKKIFSLRHGILEFTRRPARSQLLVVCIGLGLFLLSTVLFLGHALRQQLNVADRMGVPNFYLLGIPHEVLPKLQKMLPELHAVPTTQARLASVKSTAIADIQTPDEDLERFYQTREYFISRQSALSPGERLVDGTEIFGPPKKGFLRASLEESFASRMGLKKGDSFEIEIAGVVLPAEVRSIRQVDWFDMQPNFFMTFSDDDLKDAPMDDVGFARVPKDQIESDQKKVSAEFPQITPLDGDALGQRLMGLLNQLSLCVFSVSLFTLGSCFFVLVGLTLARRPELVRELSLWRCLGLSRKRLKRVFLIEALLTGFLASFVANLSSLVTVSAICKWVLEIPMEWPGAALFSALIFAPPIFLTLALSVLISPMLKQTTSQLIRDADVA